MKNKERRKIRMWCLKMVETMPYNYHEPDCPSVRVGRAKALECYIMGGEQEMKNNLEPFS